MSFLFKKVIKPWNASKEQQTSIDVGDQPVSPPPPDLSHLTADEISVINDVIRRQEEFDRLEATRVRRIKEDLDHLQDKLVKSSSSKNKQRNDIDLRLCRLCLKNKFADGVGRVCYDCQQRVCSQCGSFSKPKWNYRRNKSMRGVWRCRLCSARREALCRTGGWYHADEQSLDLTEDLKMRLTSFNDCDTDAWSYGYQENETTNVEDSDLCPSGNRSDSELLQQAPRPLSSRRPSASKYTRRKSLPPDSVNGEDRSIRKCRGLNDKKQDGCPDVENDDEDDEEESFDSLVLHRKMSRRRRQEKKQRRRWRNGQDTSFENAAESQSTNLKTAMDQKRDYPMGYHESGHSSQRDHVVRDVWGHSVSLGRRKASPVPSEVQTVTTVLSSTTENSSVVSSFRESSDGGMSSPSPILSTLRITRQDAISLGSSCISIASTGDGTSSRRGDAHMAGLESSHERLNAIGRDPSFSAHFAHARDIKPHVLEKTSSASNGDSTLTKWKKKGYKDAYVIDIQGNSKDQISSIVVIGGNLCSRMAPRAILQWVSSELRSRLVQGHEILEWNDKTLKDKTFDQVTCVTSCWASHIVLVINPLAWTESGQIMDDEPTPLLSDRQSSYSPSIDAQGKGTKRRMLPRTPVEIKRGIRQVHGEIQVRLFYQVTSASLTVTIRKAKDIGLSSEVIDHYLPSPFVLVHIIPRRGLREPIETEVRTSTTTPEWEQSFQIEGLSLTELTHKSVELSVWSYDERGDIFLGEVLIDLNEADLNDKSMWYQFQEHDENNSPLPQRCRKHSASMSESLTSGSFHFISPAVSPEVPFHRQHSHSPSFVSTTTSPVPFRAARIGSKGFHLNSVSQPDSFTTKVRKKMRDTVNKMSSLSLNEKRDNVTGSDESPQLDIHRRSSVRSDRKSPSNGKRKHNSRDNQNYMDLLAPPHPPSRTNSSSSFLWSEDEESRNIFTNSVTPSISDRPPPEGDDITSILGPGQIPPKPSAEVTVCGDIKLGFMVSKGQLEVDIICAADLHRSGHAQAPGAHYNRGDNFDITLVRSKFYKDLTLGDLQHLKDTYVKTYLVEGRKVIQRKKIVTVKSSFDPVYRKTIKYSACNVHGRIMKIDIWERTGSFEKKCRGEVLVRLDHLDLSTHTMAWYKLFQINATDYGSDEFLNNW